MTQLGCPPGWLPAGTRLPCNGSAEPRYLAEGRYEWLAYLHDDAAHGAAVAGDVEVAPHFAHVDGWRVEASGGADSGDELVATRNRERRMAAAPLYITRLWAAGSSQ